MDPFNNPGIISTTDYANLLNSAQNDLGEFQNDPYQRLFNALRQRNQQAEEQARLNAEAAANRAKVQQEQQFRGQEARTESSNIAGGLSRYAPELATSQMGQVYQANLSKVEAIQNEEDLAIARAKEARQANDLDVLQEQIKYIQQLRKAKADALSEANQMAFEREKFAEDKRQFGLRYDLDVKQEARLASESSGGKYSEADILNYARALNNETLNASSIPEDVRSQVLGVYQKIAVQDFKDAIQPTIQADINQGFSSKKILRKLKRQFKSEGQELDSQQAQLLEDYINELMGI